MQDRTQSKLCSGEFRLRDISEAIQDWHVILGFNEKWHFPMYCICNRHKESGFQLQIIRQCDCEVEPTHFIEFKIGDKWTHEFKMGEECET